MLPGRCNLCFLACWSCRKAYKQLVLSGSTKAREVMRMSDYQILMLMFTVIGLFLAFYKQGRDDSKK